MANNQKELLSDRDYAPLGKQWLDLIKSGISESFQGPAYEQPETPQYSPESISRQERVEVGIPFGPGALRSLISLLFKGGKNRGIVGTTFPHRGRPRTTGYPKHDFRPRDPQTGKLMSQVSRDPVWDATQASVRKADAEKIRRAAEWRAEKARRNIDDLIGIDETGMTNIEREQLITKLLKKN